jgi:hypothetical protein
VEASFFEEMYKELCKLSVTGVIGVRQNDKEIVIDVGQVDIKGDDGVVYDIGEFDIIINPLKGKLKCINRIRDVDGFHHPSVDEDGLLTMIGEALPGIGVLVGRGDYAPAVSMAIQFLRSYSPESSLHGVENWPVKER